MESFTRKLTPKISLYCLLSLTLLLPVTQNQCQADYSLQNIEAGLLNIQQIPDLSTSTIVSTQQSTQNIQNYTYSFTTSFTSTQKTPTPTVAIGINNFQRLTHNNDNPGGNGFYIKAAQVTRTGIIFETMSQSNWVMLTINFIAMGPQVNQDGLLLGHTSHELFRDQSYQIRDEAGVLHRNLIVQIQTPQSSRSILDIMLGSLSGYVKGQVWLNGLTYSSSYQQIAAQSRNFEASLQFDSLLNSTTLIVKTLSNNQIQSVYLSYRVAVPVLTASSMSFFEYWGGSITHSTIQSIYNYNLQPEMNSPHIYQSPYKLFGLSSIRIIDDSQQQSIASQNKAFISSIDQDMVLSIYSSSQLQDVSLSYFVIGKDSQTDSSICQGCFSSVSVYSWLLYNGTCIRNGVCPSNSYVSKNGRQCLVCSAHLNLQLNSQGNGCVCRSGVVPVSENSDELLVYGCMRQESVNQFRLNNVNIQSLFQNTQSNVKSSGSFVSFSGIPAPSTPSSSNDSNVILVDSSATISSSTTNSSNQSQQTDQYQSQQMQYCQRTYPNSFWNGFNCSCKVGYELNSDTNQCQQKQYRSMPLQSTSSDSSTASSSSSSSFLPPPSTSRQYPLKYLPTKLYLLSDGQNPTAPCTLPNEQFNPQTNQCECISTHQRVNGLCVFNNNNSNGCNTSNYEYWNGVTCACQPWFNRNQFSGQCIFNDTNPSFCTRLYEAWNGTRCVCISGYTRNASDSYRCTLNNNGTDNNQTNQNCSSANNQIWNSTLQSCICRPFFTRSPTNPQQCIPIPTNPQCSQFPNQIDNGLGICICITGYVFDSTNTCIPQPIVNTTCPANSQQSFPNGPCTCIEPFIYNISNTCSRCPLPDQIYQASSGLCLIVCGVNEFYNETQRRCMCLPGYGIGAQGQCQMCVQPYFLISGNTLNSDGYCVRCPINQIYDSTTQRCRCQEGYFLAPSGQCEKQCANNEIFNQGFCQCVNGLGRFPNPQSSCTICPDDFPRVDPNTQQCVRCGINEEYNGENCVCRLGYLKTDFNVCLRCDQFDNTFLLPGGQCAKCAGNRVYNPLLQRCTCPSGTSLAPGSFSTCIPTCLSDQILDPQTNQCYKCPVNEVITTNPTNNISTCTCASGYVRSTLTGACQLVCPIGYFQFRGQCATCPPNRIYNSQLRGCICRDGFYLNENNICTSLTTLRPTCQSGQYFDIDFGCMECGRFCRNCLNSTVCLDCFVNTTAASYSLDNGICYESSTCGDGFINPNTEQCDDNNTFSFDGCSSNCIVEAGYRCNGQPSFCNRVVVGAICGNGLLESGEQCDDQNTFNGDGCSSSCLVEARYTCVGQPSRCTFNPNYHLCGNGFIQSPFEQCDDQNLLNGDGCNTTCMIEQNYTCLNQPSVCTPNGPIDTGLALVGEIRYNINNIFCVLRTTQRNFTFVSESDMQNFMKSNVTSNDQPTTYCLQHIEPNEKDLFDCLLIYPSGVPNQVFEATFFFDYNDPLDGGKNHQGTITIEANPLEQQQSGIRNLRR